MMSIVSFLIVLMCGFYTPIQAHQVTAPSFKIGSFNIRTFGVTKMSNETVADILAKIISGYDIITVQEVRDVSGKAIIDLWNQVKSYGAKMERNFNLTISDRLGRTSSKEQYAFFYDTNRVTLEDTYQYDDGPDDGSDPFEREPFAVKYKLKESSVPEIVLIAIHVKPLDVVNELEHLYHVYQDVKKHWSVEDIIIAGDLNADCSYIDPRQLAKLELTNKDTFDWLITRCHGSTAVGSVCLYDHFIVAGSALRNYGVIPDSAAILPFGDVYKLTYNESLDVSDHYPIEFQLTGKSLLDSSVNLTTSTQFDVTETIPKSKLNSIRTIYRSANMAPNERAYFNIELLKMGSANYRVIARRLITSSKKAMDALRDFQKSFSDVLSSSVLDSVEAYLMADQPDKALPHSLVVSCHKSGGRNCPAQYQIKIDCILKTPLSCSVAIKRIVQL